MRHAAAHAKYNTDNQSENSIAYQFREITGSCTRNSIGLAGAYTDEARSGTNFNRRGFQAFVASAGAHNFDATRATISNKQLDRAEPDKRPDRAAFIARLSINAKRLYNDGYHHLCSALSRPKMQKPPTALRNWRFFYKWLPR